ncbi:hypothetical protein FKW77_005193 [Venturia effusa]|uniref:Uncharacterized protein n=1 Tax=Venturia effusa TaxID=50376 RepID=A0A517LNY4_9PEZI|nr:hypothetical protein FKW77_005193 [Venturia effusa]
MTSFKSVKDVEVGDQVTIRSCPVLVQRVLGPEDLGRPEYFLAGYDIIDGKELSQSFHPADMVALVDVKYNEKRVVRSFPNFDIRALSGFETTISSTNTFEKLQQGNTEIIKSKSVPHVDLLSATKWKVLNIFTIRKVSSRQRHTTFITSIEAIPAIFHS